MYHQYQPSLIWVCEYLSVSAIRCREACDDAHNRHSKARDAEVRYFILLREYNAGLGRREEATRLSWIYATRRPHRRSYDALYEVIQSTSRPQFGTLYSTYPRQPATKYSTPPQTSTRIPLSHSRLCPHHSPLWLPEECLNCLIRHSLFLHNCRLTQ